MSRTPPRVIGATSESSSHRLPSVKSASGRAVSASANDHRLLTQTCDASPYRGMLRVGAWCSNWGTPAGRTNLLLRFGLGQPVLPCTRSTPCHPAWQGPPRLGSRTRLLDLVCAVRRPDGGHSTARRSHVSQGCARLGLGGGCGDRRASPGRRLEARRLSRALGIGCGELRSRHRPIAHRLCDPPGPDRASGHHRP
jgi:hypothetical protein